MIDDQASTAYEFAAADPAPTALIDLGRERSVGRISAIFAEQPGAIEFYVLKDLPNDGENEGSDVRPIANVGQNAELPKSLKLSEKTIAKLKAVGSVDGANGRAAIDFPEMTGRYVMLEMASSGYWSKRVFRRPGGGLWTGKAYRIRSSCDRREFQGWEGWKEPAGW